MAPKNSIIIPCFNQELELKQILYSVFEQTYTNLEYLITDEGANDHSARIAQNRINKDQLFRLLQKTNNGLSSAFIHGLTNRKLSKRIKKFFKRLF